MDYYEVRFHNDPAMNEILIAFLGESEFDMFEEREDGLNAYVPAGRFQAALLPALIAGIPGHEKIRYETAFIRDQNWNRKWESNFEPVVVADRVYIRAPFHPARGDVDFEMVIEPKMSFGTGHHATTSGMVEQLLKIPVAGKSVLDMGCGTSVLAILAAQMGAGEVTAIDIDDWCVENSRENIRRNGVDRVNVHKGDATMISGKTFDIILANINRNVLLQDLPAYSQALRSEGWLVLSGFYEEDLPAILSKADECGFRETDHRSRDRWMSVRLRKI